MILDEIINNKGLEVSESKKLFPLDLLKEKAGLCPRPKNFFDALQSKNNETRIIAEIKKASPSKGVICKDFDPVEISINYSNSGANAISVLTDKKYFQGSLDDLKQVRDTVNIPLLRKDFIIDPYQVYESKIYGADAVLLIVAALDPILLLELKELIESLDMHPLVEVHDEEELEIALDNNCDIIGINNRDLKTFHVDLNTAIRLVKLIPANKLVISESGIKNNEDISLLNSHGIHTFLIGEILMKLDDPSNKLTNFLGLSN